MKTIATRLEKELSLRLSAVHLVDAHYCSDASKFISVCMTSLNAMMQMEMPHVNVLSKVDTIEKYGKLNFNIGTSRSSTRKNQIIITVYLPRLLYRGFGPRVPGRLHA